MSSQITEREDALASVRKSGVRALENVSDELKADSSFMLDAFNYCGFKYAPDKLKADKHFMLAAAKLDGNALEYVSDELKKDIDIVLAVVSFFGVNPSYKSNDLMADRIFMLHAIKKSMGS